MEMDKMKVGVISIYWPPHFGGAEKYVHTMVKELVNNGVDAWGITATPISKERDNGIDNVVRIGEETHCFDKRGCERWFEQVIEHISQNNYSHIIVNSPLTRVYYGYTEKLFDGLRATCPNIKIGVVHHDIGLRLRLALEEEYSKTKDWNKSAERVEQEQVKLFNSNKSSLFTFKDGYWCFDSPLYFQPDFLIGNTEWSNRFTDPLNTIPKFLLHPPIEDLDMPKSNKLERVNITMINPLFHKGRSYMADFINDYNHNWTFRVLLGSYGGSKKDFIRMIEDSWAMRDGRVEILSYVENIEDVYDATDVFIYPSRYEGYGMSAIEPMYRGVPVLVQNYPAIIEAVNDSAIVMPYDINSKEWIEKVEELLLDEEYYKEFQEKGYVHKKYLKNRQDKEIKELIEFLESLV